LERMAPPSIGVFENVPAGMKKQRHKPVGAKELHSTDRAVTNTDRMRVWKVVVASPSHAFLWPHACVNCWSGSTHQRLRTKVNRIKYSSIASRVHFDSPSMSASQASEI
jgi:hypothetical protein